MKVILRSLSHQNTFGKVIPTLNEGNLAHFDCGMSLSVTAYQFQAGKRQLNTLKIDNYST